MAKNLRKIVLLGPQASGKSTQSKLIVDFLNIPIVAASQVLREVIAQGGEMADKLKATMDQGLLVPDEYMIDLVLKKLGSDSCLNGFLLDGFPRNLQQAKALDEKCGLDMVFNIEVSDEVAMKRITGRRICANGHLFHIEFQASSKGDICDICDSPLQQRADDAVEVVKKRLSIYREETTKLLDYYKKQDKLVVFDGEKTIEDVSKDILNYLEKNVR